MKKPKKKLRRPAPSLPSLRQLAKKTLGAGATVVVTKDEDGGFEWGINFGRTITRQKALRLVEAVLLEFASDPVLGGSPIDALGQRDKLWQLLDDIDTQDDACREHDDAYRARTRRIQKKRWAIYKPSGT